MTDTKPIMVRTREQNYGDHGAFIITFFKRNGDTREVLRPIAYASISIEPETPGVILFKDANGEGRWQEIGKQAQDVLNAISERKECKFYYE